MAFDMNTVHLIGRLTKDPELKHTQNQTAYCKFSIANNRMAGDKEEVNFFDVTTWTKIAENCSKYLKKGSQVAITGRLEQQRWQDKDGNNRNKIEIVAQSVQFMSKANNQDGSSTPPAGAPPEAQSGSPLDIDSNLDDEDEVPF